MFENLVKYTSSSCQLYTLCVYTLLYWKAKKGGNSAKEWVKFKDRIRNCYALCSCLLKEDLKWDISQTGCHSIGKVFLLKDVAHWSSQSFHWLLWKNFHLLCSTLKRWKEGSEFKLIKNQESLFFEKRIFFSF